MIDLKRSAGSSLRKAMTAGQVRLVIFGAFVAATFAAVGLLHTMTHVAVVDVGYRLSQVEAKHRELIRENEHLKMERATLRSAPRLEAIAKAKLNMAPPTAGQVIAVGAQPKPVTAQKTVTGQKTAVAQVARPNNQTAHTP